MQFIGLRTLHWGATIAQLVATIAMVVVRAWLRANLLEDLRCEKLLSKHEISDAAFAICRKKLPAELVPRGRTCTWKSKDNPTATGRVTPEYENFGWGLLTGVELEISNPNTAAGNPSQTNDTEANAESSSSVSSVPNLSEPESHAEIRELSHWVERLMRTRFELGRFTKWEEECTIWGERVASAVEDVFRKSNTMSSGETPSLDFKIAKRTKSWQLATYVRRTKNLISKSILTIDPETLPNDWYAGPNDREGQIRRVKDFYSAILCLWHCRIAKRREGVNYKTQFPFARVVDASRTEVKRSGLIQDWLRTPLSPVPPDYHWTGWTLKLFDPALSFGRQFAIKPSVNNLKTPSGITNPEKLALAVDGGTYIPRLYAQELFSMCIFDLASRIRCIHEGSIVDPDGKLSNKVIDDLAVEVCSSGLANSLEEARTLVVPSFYYQDLLVRPLHRDQTALSASCDLK